MAVVLFVTAGAHRAFFLFHLCDALNPVWGERPNATRLSTLPTRRVWRCASQPLGKWRSCWAAPAAVPAAAHHICHASNDPPMLTLHNNSCKVALSEFVLSGPMYLRPPGIAFFWIFALQHPLSGFYMMVATKCGAQGLSENLFVSRVTLPME